MKPRKAESKTGRRDDPRTLLLVLREQHPKATKAEMFKIFHEAIRQPANEDHLLGIIEETVGGWFDEFEDADG